MVQQRRRPSGFIEPCQPSKVARPPSGPLWVHEIKHDGSRLMVRKDGERVRCFTRGGHDWADRFPAIVAAASKILASSFLIDGEAVIARDDGTPDFHALRSKRRGHEAVLFAFDLIEHDGADLRDLPLIDRKRRLARLIGRAKHAIRFVEHLTDDGPTVFEHVCRTGLEASCRSGRMRPIAAVHRRHGSSRRTRQARRCAGSARKTGGLLGRRLHLLPD
jgi:bifunctional non-homologous end joining protein LigD